MFRLLQMLPLVLFGVFALSAQDPVAQDRWAYVAACETTGTTLKCSVSVPSNATRRIRLLSGFVGCATAACDYLVVRDGTTPTATAGTVRKLRSIAPTAQALWWTASDSTGGTALPATITIPYATATPLDLADIDLVAGQNFSITITSATSQKLQIAVKFEEL